MSTTAPDPLTTPRVGNIFICEHETDHRKEPWFLTATFWKRFSVVLSLAFSVASLILGAFASLRTESTEVLRGLQPPFFGLSASVFYSQALNTRDINLKSDSAYNLIPGRKFGFGSALSADKSRLEEADNA